MKPETLKLMLDKVLDGIPGISYENDKGRPMRDQIHADIKLFAEAALEGILKEIALYGTNTWSYNNAKAFLIEFRGKV